jgi:hypothetical protein
MTRTYLIFLIRGETYRVIVMDIHPEREMCFSSDLETDLSGSDDTEDMASWVVCDV